MQEAKPYELRRADCLRAAAGHAVAIALAAWPGLAAAMKQCPPEAGEKSPLFLGLGWGVLGLFVLLGLSMPVLGWRLSRRRSAGWRALALLLGVALMFAVWLLGLAVFLVFFVLPC